MDIPRRTARRNKIIRRIIIGAIVVAAIPLITLGLSRLKPAAPSVEGSTVWRDTVKRGPMVRQVRGLGTLMPESILWIPAITQGRVDKILVQPGTQVTPDTIIIEMSNPELENQMLAAEYDWKAADAAYTNLKVTLESARLTQQAVVTKAKSDHLQATLRAQSDEELGKLGLKPPLEVKLSEVTAENLDSQQKIEQQRLDISADSTKAQLDAQRVQVDQKKALYELKKSQVDQLKVRAGTDGVLSSLGTDVLRLEVGQQIQPGGILAKVVQPWKLKAELKIAETQAKDILLGQPAQVDTRNGIIPGHVSRIDPASVNGTVAVDVKLDGKLPQGARPDLSVDGTIELERLADVLYVGRPVYGQAQSLVTLFKVDPDGKGAIRVQVKLGRSSVNTIEILEGLRVSDTVILSDMSAWDAYDRIRLN
ncbi:MAG: HlyD family efflux transporter periplasmic adaptor subunit [Acidobacteria bacterium]|nr:HlyD family efflux transporter periplasmic adaptor subunit [Acidobacteriota bacterium]